MLSAIDVANYIVLKADMMKKPVSNLKLQKLLYYAQGECLAQTGRPLFYEEIEAWPYGPVVRDVYIKYVASGALDLHPDKRLSIPQMNTQEKKCVDSVLEEKIQCTASQLVEATHRERPWRDHAKEVECGEKPVISNEKICDFFNGAAK